MLLDNKGGKNDNRIAMTVAAIAFPDNLWKRMLNDNNLGMDDVRKIASAVNSSVAAKIKELEIKHWNRKEDGNFKPPKNQRAVASKWKKVAEVLKKSMYKTEDQFQAFISKELGEKVKGRQTTITGFTVGISLLLYCC